MVKFVEGSSVTRAMFEEGKKMAVEFGAENVYDFSLGNPSVEPPKQVKEAIIETLNEDAPNFVHGYMNNSGYEEVRERIAQSLNRRFDTKFSQNNIIMTVGAAGGLNVALKTLLDPGDEVIAFAPYFGEYNNYVANFDGVMVVVPADVPSFQLDLETFAKKITAKTKAVIVNNPNNPTGYLYSQQELEQLRDIVLKHDLFLICDEVYREFCYDGAKHFSAMNLTGLEQNVIMIDSVSKRYSMCGVRLGTLASRNEEVLDAVLRMGQARLCPPYLAQVAALAALDTPKSYFEEVHDEYMARRDCIVKALNEIEGVYCPTPRGAFYSIVRLPVDDSERFARWLLEEFRYNDRTVMLAPAAGFYGTPGLGRDEVRIAYVLKREDLLAAAECMKEALKVYPGRTIR